MLFCRVRRIFIFAIFISASTLASIDYTNYVIVGGKQWAQPVDFMGLNWNDINLVCPEINGGLCFENTELNGFNMSGWIWADRIVLSELHTHEDIGVTLSASDLVNQRYIEPDSSWAPAFFSIFTPTLQGANFNYLAALTRESIPAQPGNFYLQGVEDWSLPSTNPDVADLRYTWSKSLTDNRFGAWFYRSISIAIDIKPGSEPNCFNINDRGVIPVAILGSNTFDVNEIVYESLSFAGLDVRVRGNKGPLCHVDDANDDGLSDLVCQFEDNEENWSPGDDIASLTGTLVSGVEFEGEDSICVVP
ncbi:hypothetical protein [Vibrio sp. dhg]|uniref:hypothetical protein n=1 Tax=Vibrio sp. dhg TaxID=2163016 RepID=UPI000E52F82A|nr:hypothetical protein [Vibrio sp. dhg]AXT72920.1 hypothetical protein DBX26_18340 [Vibrio sp. dhg]